MSAPRAGTALTPRETEYLQAVARGATHRELARRWGVTENTARSTGHRVIAKLGAATMANAVHIAWAAGLMGSREDCGTRGSYERHRKKGEYTDPACRRANVAYELDRRGNGPG